MELKITRGQPNTPVTEDMLLDRYAAEKLSPYAWSNGPNDTYPPHQHAYHKVLMVVSGSITWVLPENGQEVETFPGDRIDLPRGTLHAAHVGPNGVTCLEAHISAD